MKLGERYYSIGENIRNIIITLLVVGLTLFLSGIRFGCTKIVDARCIGTSIEHYIAQHIDSHGLISPAEYKEELVRGIYQYEIDGQLYEWVDQTPFGHKNPKENEIYKIIVNPNKPAKATVINIGVLILGGLVSLIILYGTVWSIMSNRVYIKKNGKKTNKKNQSRWKS